MAPRHRKLTSPQKLALKALSNGYEVDVKKMKESGHSSGTLNSLLFQDLIISAPCGSYSTASYTVRITFKGQQVLSGYDNG